MKKIIDPVFDLFAEEEKANTVILNKLSTTRKIKVIDDYKPLDFVRYFKRKFEEVYEVPYPSINKAASCIVMKQITSPFLSKGFKSDVILKFIDWVLTKGAVSHKVIKLRSLHYFITDFLIMLKGRDLRVERENLRELARIEGSLCTIKKRYNL